MPFEVYGGMQIIFFSAGVLFFSRTANPARYWHQFLYWLIADVQAYIFTYNILRYATVQWAPSKNDFSVNTVCIILYYYERNTVSDYWNL